MSQELTAGRQPVKELFVSPSSSVRKKTTREGFAHVMHLVLRRRMPLSSCLLMDEEMEVERD